MLYSLLFTSLFVGLCAQDWTLVWEDNFDFIDLSKWQYEVTATGGGNGEFQTYTTDPANAFVRDGTLFIKPTLTVDNINPFTGQPFGDSFLVSGTLDLNAMYGQCTNSDNSGCYRTGQDIPPVMSARLRSLQRFAFKYGRVEVVAKMPTGDWFWPAFWLLPENYVYGGWPRSGEMDMVEIRGNPDLIELGSGRSIGSDSMGSTLHWGTRYDENKYYLTHNERYNTSNNFGDHFHHYAMEWSSNGIRMFVDNFEVLTVPNPQIDQNPSWQGFWEFGKPWTVETENIWASGNLMAPFDQEFHFVMNVAVGGTGGYFPDNVMNRQHQYPKPWTNGQGYWSGMRSFWEKRSDWHWTWTNEGDNAALQIQSVKVFQRTPLS